MYGSQVVSVVAQFAYAAVTSRQVGPAEFGAYAIALSVAGLVTLLASGGIAQSVARMVEMEQNRLRGLVTFSVLLGLVSAGFVFITASFWASLWGEPEARNAIEILTLAVLMAPLSGVGTSLLRRQGSFRLLAGLTLCSNLIGMIVGAIVVFQLKTAVALAVSAIIAQALILIGSLLATKGIMLGFGSIGLAKSEVAFSGSLSAIKISEYLIGNIMKFSVSRWMGASFIGYWNRADTVATLPFQQVQTALLQAVSPEFRHDIENPRRAFRVWSDLLIMVAWFVLPISVLAAIILPGIVPVLFGPGWQFAAALTTPLAIAAGLQTVSMVLSTAVESLGRFRWMWITSGFLIAFQVLGATTLLLFRDISVALACLIATQIIRHGLQVFICGRYGYLDVRGLLVSYLAVGVFSIVVGTVGWTIGWLVNLAETSPSAWLGAVGVGFFACGALWFGRESLPPLRLAQTYGLYRRNA